MAATIGTVSSNSPVLSLLHHSPALGLLGNDPYSLQYRLCTKMTWTWSNDPTDRLQCRNSKYWKLQLYSVQLY